MEPDAEPVRGALTPAHSAKLPLAHRPALAVALLLGALALFAFGLDRESLWLDETFTDAMTRHAWSRLWTLTTEDVHPPLYYFVAKAARSVLGPSNWALRVPSVLAALGLVSFGLGPVRRIWNERVGLRYTVLAMLSPATLCFAQDARMYTLLAFFVTGSILYGILSVTAAKPRDFVWFGVFTLGACYTHYYGVLTVAMASLALLTMTFRRDRISSRKLSLTLVLIGLCYLPWTFSSLQQVGRVAQGFWIPSPSPLLVAMALVAPYTYKFEDVMFPWHAPVVVSLVLGAVAWATWRAPTPVRTPLRLLSFVYCATLGFALTYSWAVVPVLMPRYLIACLGVFLVMASVAVEALKTPWARNAIVLALVGSSLPTSYEVLTESFNGPYREAARYIERHGGTGDAILHHDVHTLYPCWNVLPEARHVLLLPPTAEPWAPGAGIYASDRLEGHNDLDQVLDETRTVWLVGPTLEADYEVTPRSITERPDWQISVPTQRIALDRSWVKLELTQLSRSIPRRTLHRARSPQEDGPVPPSNQLEVALPRLSGTGLPPRFLTHNKPAGDSH